MEPNLTCPIPHTENERILLAHGGGGTLTQRLLEQVFRPAFANPWLEQRHDSAVLPPSAGRLAFTTDSYVVRPLFFPGGDIGTLAVNGTVNDLAMAGARPLYLSAGFILEEGVSFEVVRRVAASMRAAAAAAHVHIVTGDTKVVDKGKGDGLYINTAGIGVLEHELTIGPASIRAGDAILVNGDLARHGMAIMTARTELAFDTPLVSDCAPVAAQVLALLRAGIEVHCLRDLTRGGLATALVELAETARLHLRLEEQAIPVVEEVRGACEILGFDPLYVANEGRFVCFLPEAQVAEALAVLRAVAGELPARRIGSVGADGGAVVTLSTLFGAQRLLPMLSGEQLPRIC